MPTYPSQRGVVGSRRSRSAHQSILLYSHDTYGLGHFRRNSAIALALRRLEPRIRLVMLTGSTLAADFQLPGAVELVRMPSVVKVGADRYRPATSRSMSGLRAERTALICSTLRRVNPEVLLVDHAPLGMKGELKSALELARAQLPGTRVVLGLRDILDDPDIVRRTWSKQGVYTALERCYDQVLVYGCRDLFDVTELYAFPESVRGRTVFTGYVAKDHGLERPSAWSLAWARSRSADEQRVLVMGGGGGDAVELHRAFLNAWPVITRSRKARALLVTGPLMSSSDRTELEWLAAGRRGVELMRSTTSMLRLIGSADVVVSMGGYNGVVESLTARRPLVVFPRIAPRREQLIRAVMLSRLGLAQVVLPGPDASAEMSLAVLKALEGPSPAPDVWRRIDLGGGERVAQALIGHIRSGALAV
jgi:predicted glycosyltransferase